MNWIRIRELIRKEFVQLFRDPRMRRLLIIGPVLQLLLFGYVVTTDVRDITVAFLDQARTRESRMVLDGFTANRTFRITHQPASEQELEEVLLRSEVDLAVQVLPDFSAQIRKGNSGTIQVLADGTMSNMAAVRIAYATQVLEGINQTLMNEMYPEELEYGKIDDRIRTWYNPNLNSEVFFVPGVVGALIMMITLLFTSMAIIREREVGTLEQLIVTPLKPFELILGKTIPYVIIAIVQMVLVTLLAIYWFDIPLKGSWWLLLLGTCLFLLNTVGIGIFISTVSATQQQAMMTTFFFLLPTFLLAGLMFPIANMPEVIQWITYAIPLRYFLVIIRGVFLKDVGFDVLWPQYLALFILGMVLFAGAVSRFRKRID